MPDIFISYSRRDAARAECFADGLRAEGFDVWWDVALRAGEDFDRGIERAINEARAVVVLWSAESVASRWVRAEATIAQRNGSLAPVMIETCTRPIMFELTQTPDLSHWHGDRTDRSWIALVADIRRLVGTSKAAAVPERRARERRHVTVLCCGLARPAGDDDDPEDWHAATLGLHRAASAALAPFDCRVLPPSGESVTALFGADGSGEDDALRAIRAAFALREALAGHRHAGSALRIGIDSGPVVIGADGSVIGAPVDQALRLQLHAEDRNIMIGAATARLGGGFVELEAQGNSAFRLVGERATQTRFDLSRARGLSVFVGRARELAVIEAALEQSSTGDGQVIGVMGDAGGGKSRLCFEFTERCRARGLQVFEGRAVSNGRNVPLLPMLDLMRSFFGLAPELDAASARARIAQRALALDDRLSDALPLIHDFLSVADPAGAPVKIDPEARQRQLIGLFRHLLMAASDDTPTVVLLEDLQWFDAASLQFVEQLVDTRAGIRNLVLLNYRPDFRAEWMQQSWCRQITLAPLGADAVHDMLGDLLGDCATIAALADPIETLTRGNPFFVEEVVQTLVETGVLEGARGSYRLARPFTRLEVPPTVRAVVAARIDRLPERERRLLQTAAVVGKQFSEPVLVAVAPFPPGEIAAALAHLRRADFVAEVELFPVPEHGFRHPLTHEVALGTLLKEERRRIHADVARAIEAQDVLRLDERAAIIAQHWEEAGEALVAARWHKRAGEWVSATDFPASAWHWSRVRTLSRERSDDAEGAALCVAACTQLLNMNFRVGIDLDEARAMLEEGQALCDRLGLPGARLMLSMVFSRVLCGAGDVAGYLALAEANDTAARALGDIGLQSVAQVLLIDATSHAARFAPALAMADAALASLPADLPRDAWITGVNPRTFFSFMRGASLTWMGRLAEAVATLDDARAQAEAEGTPEVAGWCNFLLAIAHVFERDGPRAIERARALEAISTRLGSPLLVAYTHLAFAWAGITLGRPRDALAPARAALDIYTRVERHWAGAAAMLLAEAQLGVAELDAAVAQAEDAIALCERSQIGEFEAGACCVLARALLRRDGARARDRAAAALDRASAAIDRTGAVVFAALLDDCRAELAAIGG